MYICIVRDCKHNKDEFYLKLPDTKDSKPSGALHLPDRCAELFEGARQTPINPHCQRLLSASKRVAKVDSVSNEAKAKAKAKGKAKAKAKAKANAVPKVKAADVKAKAQTDYAAAKTAFFEKFLVDYVLYIIGLYMVILYLPRI